MRKNIQTILLASLALVTTALAGGPALFQDLDLQNALHQAKAENKAVLVKFDATWCGYCRAMDARTFSNDDVEKSLEDFISIKVDVDTDRGRELARKYHVRGTPYITIFSPSGEMVYSQPGYQGPEAFQETLAKVNKKI